MVHARGQKPDVPAMDYSRAEGAITSGKEGPRWAITAFYPLWCVSLLTLAAVAAFLFDIVPSNSLLLQRDSVVDFVVGWGGDLGFASAALTFVLALMARKRSFVLVSIVPVLLVAICIIRSIYNLARL